MSAVPNGCLLSCEQFGVLSRRLDFNQSAARKEFESCRRWFLMELPEADRRGPKGGLFTTEGCLWTMGHYVSVSRFKSATLRNGRRLNVVRAEQPKQLMLQLAAEKVRGWMSERPPETLSVSNKLEWLEKRQKIVKRVCQWGESNTHWFPHGRERRGRFKGEAVRHFAGTVASMAHEERKKISQDIFDLQIFLPVFMRPEESLSIQGTLFEM